MKIEVMRELIIAIDSNQVEDSYVEAANVETMADVEKVVKDWNAAKVQAWSNPDEAKADSDIEKWSKKGKA